MHKNHSVLLAIAAGVAIAGTSYAATTVLFGKGSVEKVPALETPDTQTSTSANSALPSATQELDVQTRLNAAQPSSKPSEALPAASVEAIPKALTPVYAEEQPNLALAQAILRELPGYPCADVAATPEKAVHYFYTFHDLNNDGQDEAIAYLVGSYTCGTGGCTALIFNVDDDGYTLNSRVTLVRTPVIVANTQTNGWSDLIIPVSGGGATPSDRVLHWNGQSYPSNPSIAPEWTEDLDGTALFADTITAETPAPTLAGETCNP